MTVRRESPISDTVDGPGGCKRSERPGASTLGLSDVSVRVVREQRDRGEPGR